MKIIFLGTPDYLNPIIQSLDTNFDLIKTFRSPNEDLKQIKDLEPDLLVVASFGKIIPQEILDIPKLGAINIHPSLLPKYRGPSPIQNQILDGVKDSGISFILMDNEMDHGPLLKQVPFAISEDDTFQSLCEKMFAESAKYLPEVINGLANGNLKPKEQNHSDATFTKMVEKEDGYFDVNEPPHPEKLNRMIRAFYPWPSTWTKWNGKIVKFLPNSSRHPRPDRGSINESEDRQGASSALDEVASFAYSMDSRLRGNDEFLVQMEGKKATDFKSFLNGYPDFPIKHT